MKILALTSSTSIASIGIENQGQVLTRENGNPRGHTEFFNAALDEILSSAGLKLSELDLVALDHGPGSFTGIRVAVSIARSICYSLGIPCYSVSSLEILGSTQTQNRILGINAYKNLIFTTLKKASGESQGPLVLSPNDLMSACTWFGDGPLLFQGNAFQTFGPNWSPTFKARIHRSEQAKDDPTATDLLKMAKASDPKTWIQDWKFIKPLYLRDSAAEENLQK